MSKDQAKPFRNAHTDRAAAQDAPDTPQTRAPAYKLAFADDEFMCRDELRPVRLQLELLKPELMLDEAGINSATIIVRGPMAYGYLKGEDGIHRLVRISPFNSEGKRQTSFAAVDVSPEVSDSIDIEIRDEDVRVDTYRASGAGGQHVNKTSSAVRLTHIPTGIAVQCQNERSQHKNKATAHKMLRARLARIEEEKREAEQADNYRDKARVGFGSQIRNYFLHPDQRVKDARTGYLVGNFNSVLDGNIQGFLDAFLRWRVGRE